MSENNSFGWGSTLPATAEQKEFSLPPVGEYNFIVASLEKTFSKSSGNPMMKVRLDLQGADGCVFDNIVLSDNAKFKVVTFFESIGLKEKGKESTKTNGELADMAVGKEGRCKIIHEPYNGKMQAKVKEYIVLESKKPVKLTPADEAALDDLPFEIDD